MATKALGHEKVEALALAAAFFFFVIVVLLLIIIIPRKDSDPFPPPSTPSRREAKRFVDLTADETSDLWLTAKKIGSQLESFHRATSLTFTIQDGAQAGQTVPHVHIHIIPRKVGDFEKNDEIYDAIDEKEKELKQKLDLDKERTDRSMEEMVQEAEGYRLLFSPQKKELAAHEVKSKETHPTQPKRTEKKEHVKAHEVISKEAPTQAKGEEKKEQAEAHEIESKEAQPHPKGKKRKGQKSESRLKPRRVKPMRPTEKARKERAEYEAREVKSKEAQPNPERSESRSRLKPRWLKTMRPNRKVQRVEA
ncbi:unnamed protein product [Dovyalis caffra]|uniref:HIT domain-containing protein n=1 Tax=Dovyalis caffra TaxID=77055 RepID=A0AAV1QRX2_9ROSI|nr:unnamed protein product [Dovyalis caffra]